MIADRAAQHRVAGLERVQRLAERHLSRAVGRQVKGHLPAHAGQGPQVRGQLDPDHGSVWTSTESTDGRSLTTADQVSPLSADAYTWPPVVPK